MGCLLPGMKQIRRTQFMGADSLASPPYWRITDLKCTTAFYCFIFSYTNIITLYYDGVFYFLLSYFDKIPSSTHVLRVHKLLLVVSPSRLLYFYFVDLTNRLFTHCRSICSNVWYLRCYCNFHFRLYCLNMKVNYR